MKNIAMLDFGNGRLGFERCISTDNEDKGKQFLRAFIYSKKFGRTSSDGVELPDVAAFLLEAMRQVAAVHLNVESEEEIREALILEVLTQMVDEIKAERAALKQSEGRA